MLTILQILTTEPRFDSEELKMAYQSVLQNGLSQLFYHMGEL